MENNNKLENPPLQPAALRPEWVPEAYSQLETQNVPEQIFFEEQTLPDPNLPDNPHPGTV